MASVRAKALRDPRRRQNPTLATEQKLRRLRITQHGAQHSALYSSRTRTLSVARAASMTDTCAKPAPSGARAALAAYFRFAKRHTYQPTRQSSALGLQGEVCVRSIFGPQIVSPRSTSAPSGGKVIRNSPCALSSRA
jgi:hypothetical protein